MHDHAVMCQGCKLRTRLAGEHGPWIVFVSGFPGMALDWSLVQPEVASFARTLSYDRAGLGKSSKFAGRTKTLEYHLAELDCVTSSLTQEPFLLVGHSLGGVIARQFYSRWPEKVTAMVLIDSSHEQQRARLPGAAAELLGMQRALTREVRLARLGVSQLLARIRGLELIPAPFRALVPEAQSEWLASVGSLKQKRASLAEFYGLKEMADLTLPNLGDLPLRVFTAFQSEMSEWHVLQEEITASSRCGELHVVADAGHYIQLDQPTQVVQAIWELVKFWGY